MKVAIFFTVTFFCATLWVLRKTPWVAPSFALLTAAYVCQIVIVYRRRLTRDPALRVVYTRLTFMYFGMAWLIGCLAGPPNTLRFWVLFGAVCAIFAPILTVMWRSLERDRGKPSA